ncbi:hypothetical protein electrica_03732 [Klebsiella electrica]|nr:hypothetical protein electrica_03732 [Klebsiella electrica]
MRRSRRHPGKCPPVALRLPGLQGVQSGSPDKALAPPSGEIPPVALRLPGLQGVQSGSPGKALAPPFGEIPPVALRLPGLQGVRAGSPAPGYTTCAYCSITCSSTFAPAATCPGEAYSISLWLIPSLQGIKIIPVGAR